MKENPVLENMEVIIALSDEEERELAGELMKKAGADRVDFAANTLEMVLMAIKQECAVLITEEKESAIGLADALNYINKQSRYITAAVVADGWEGAYRDELLGSVDVFISRPLEERNLVPGILVNAARKKHMRELEEELQASEQSFAEDKNMSFAERVVMDTLGAAKDQAREYIKTLAEKYGYDEGEVARIVYDVLLAGGK